jgi:predicted glycoside hydrolase/deacetylase ChbG (UPF0249 family)
MRLLIVNADDFGLARGVNEGIVMAHTNGILTSASLMVLPPAAAEAGMLARAYPDLSVGLHFVEDDSAALDHHAFAERSFRAQLERFRDLIGRDPTHVDSHHHVHSQGRRMAMFRGLVEPLGVPLRKDGNVAYIGGFWGQSERGVTNLDHIRRPFLRQLIETEAEDGFSELACHPARVTDDLHSSYLHEREVELQTLTEPGLRQELEESGVTLVSYHNWLARR